LKKQAVDVPLDVKADEPPAAATSAAHTKEVLEGMTVKQLQEMLKGASPNSRGSERGSEDRWLLTHALILREALARIWQEGAAGGTIVGSVGGYVGTLPRRKRRRGGSHAASAN
jgi:hypothetical protein